MGGVGTCIVLVAVVLERLVVAVCLLLGLRRRGGDCKLPQEY